MAIVNDSVEQMSYKNIEIDMLKGKIPVHRDQGIPVELGMWQY